MGYHQMGVPKKLALKLQAEFDIKNFVETGTWKGGTSFWAASHFQRVVTLEISPEISQRTAASPECPKNIEFLVGDSAKLLASVVSGLQGGSLFWLDGHYSGLGTGADNECPLMDELAALRPVQDAVIMIDDARCFLGPPPLPHDPNQWVNVDVIFQYLRDHFPNHVTTIHVDVIISIPGKMKHVLDEDWRNHYLIRFAPLTFLERILAKLRRMFGKSE